MKKFLSFTLKIMSYTTNMIMSFCAFFSSFFKVYKLHFTSYIWFFLVLL
ncbi:hypothetical protein KSS87_011843 [Heliosperma pusillum]|nr:hypothetical protein KSS87_011843 [Heliosperma pusillum]